MFRSEGGAQGRVDAGGISRSEIAPARADAVDEDQPDAELLNDAEQGRNGTPKARAVRHTTTREVLAAC